MTVETLKKLQNLKTRLEGGRTVDAKAMLVELNDALIVVIAAMLEGLEGVEKR